MKKNKLKIFILITDGISLRNFAYTNFYNEGIKQGYDVVFLHNTPFDLETLGFKQITIKSKLHWLTTILKNARKRIELKSFKKRFSDPIYLRYAFILPSNTLKNKVKSFLTKCLIFTCNSAWGLRTIRNFINVLERSTNYYKQCQNIFETHKPDLVYCTSHRSALAIAPIQAAKQLNIPTIGFVYSWDNLPKATLDVLTDYYHVWSSHMKEELLKYQPFISENHIKVTGTPQFELHFDENKMVTKERFYDQYGLNKERTYICFSGDDITTSPKDPMYLRDVAKAVRELNNSGYMLGLIFRRCPVDISNRYDAIISEYNDVITPIEPLWEVKGQVWNSMLPTKEDATLLAALAKYTAFVVNLGSSMVFDYAIHDKICMFMNYNYFNSENNPNKGVYVYDFVHFRSKPSNHVVCWLNHPNDIANSIKKLLNNDESILKASKEWFSIINQQPSAHASIRIWKEINALIC